MQYEIYRNIYLFIFLQHYFRGLYKQPSLRSKHSCPMPMCVCVCVPFWRNIVTTHTHTHARATYAACVCVCVSGTEVGQFDISTSYHIRNIYIQTYVNFPPPLSVCVCVCVRKYLYWTVCVCVFVSFTG